MVSNGSGRGCRVGAATGIRGLGGSARSFPRGSLSDPGRRHREREVRCSETERSGSGARRGGCEMDGSYREMERRHSEMEVDRSEMERSLSETEMGHSEMEERRREREMSGSRAHRREAAPPMRACASQLREKLWWI